MTHTMPASESTKSGVIKMRIRKLYYRAYIRWLAFRWIFHINLGDEVLHDGRVRTVINGVIPTCWTLLDPYEECVNRSEVTKHWTIRNILRSYRSGVRFYEDYWLDIWIRNGIEPWIRACNIWPGSKP